MPFYVVLKMNYALLIAINRQAFMCKSQSVRFVRMFVSFSFGLAVTLFLIGSSRFCGWLSEVVGMVRVFLQSRDAFNTWVSPGASVCPEAVCEVPEGYGRGRHIVRELVLAVSWWLEVVIGISLAMHACCLGWGCCQSRHRRPCVGRHVVGFHTPSPARRSLARELL